MKDEPVLEPTTLIVPPGQGTLLHAFGDTVQVTLSGEQTGGACTVLMCGAPPGGGPPPHIHRREDEIILVIEGQYCFLRGDEWSEPIGPGAVAYTPRGVRHAYRNVGETPSRHWVIATPAGFERFFAQCAGVFAQPGTPDPAAIEAIGEQYGIAFVPPLTAPTLPT